VSYVGGIKEFPRFARVKKNNKKHSLRLSDDPFDDKDCNHQGCAYCPKRLRALMNISDYKSTNPKSIQAFANFLGENYSIKDLEIFNKTYDSPFTQIEKQIGDNDELNPTTEASLDVQYISSIGNNTRTWSFTTEGTQDLVNEPFVKMFTTLLAMDEHPLVLSMSYADELDSVDAA